jgi:hypothetical protein
MDKKESLRVLKREKTLEDEIIITLLEYYETSLDEISQITNENKERIKEIFLILITDSKRHSQIFEDLIKWVTENDKDSY